MMMTMWCCTVRMSSVLFMVFICREFLNLLMTMFMRTMMHDDARCSWLFRF